MPFSVATGGYVVITVMAVLMLMARAIFDALPYNALNYISLKRYDL